MIIKEDWDASLGNTKRGRGAQCNVRRKDRDLHAHRAYSPRIEGRVALLRRSGVARWYGETARP